MSNRSDIVHDHQPPRPRVHVALQAQSLLQAEDGAVIEERLVEELQVSGAPRYGQEAYGEDIAASKERKEDQVDLSFDSMSFLGCIGDMFLSEGFIDISRDLWTFGIIYQSVFVFVISNCGGHFGEIE